MALPKIKWNITAQLQYQPVPINDKYGEAEEEWITVRELNGRLQRGNPTTERILYKGKMEQADHSFFCDYKTILKPDGTAYNIHDLRLFCKGRYYDILLMDNVQEMDYHYEFYLKAVDA